MTNDLLLRADALPGLLSGWVGPVVDTGWNEPKRMVWNDNEHRYFDPDLDIVWLDLSLPECRDRVVRVLAKAVGLECGSTAPAFTEHRWDASRDWMIRDPQRRTRFFSPVPPDSAMPEMWVTVPSLLDLDGSDNDTHLPDGSRRVDALALKLVAEHVGRSL